MVAALGAAWGAGGLALLRGLEARHAARLAERAAAVGMVLEATQAALIREARLLARDPAVADGAIRGDWGTLARGASPRMVALAVERLADLLLILDASGVTLAQVPAVPQHNLSDIAPPASASIAVRLVGGRAFLLALAPVPGSDGGPLGTVVVGRRLEYLGRAMAGGAADAAIVALAGDRLVGGTRPDLPSGGWHAALGAGGVIVAGQPAALRPLDASAGLWAVVPTGEQLAERRRLLLALGATLALATVAAGVAWLAGSRPRAHRELLAQGHELDALYAVARTMARGSDVPSTAEQLLDIVCAVAGMQGGAVYRLDANALTMISQRGLAPAELARLRVRPVDDGAVGQAARTGQVLVNDLEPKDFAATLGRRTELALPISADGRTWGVMALVSPDRRRFRPEEMKLLEAVAHQIGLAVTRASLVVEAREKGRRLEALAGLGRTLTATLSLDDVLQRVVDAAVTIFDASESRLWLVDEDGRTLSLQAASGSTAPVVGQYRFAVGEGLVGALVQARRPLVVPDLVADPRVRNRERVIAEGLVSLAGVPITLGGRILGALTIAVRRWQEYAAEEIELLESVAHHAAAAIDSARRFAEETARRAQLAALLEINTKIGAAESLDALLRTIAEEAARLLAVDNAGFRLVEGDELVLAGLAGTAAQTMVRARIKIGESFSGRVVREGRALICDAADVPDLIPEHKAADERLGYTGFLGVPLRAG